jgi:hypothetical protein
MENSTVFGFCLLLFLVLQWLIKRDNVNGHYRAHVLSTTDANMKPSNNADGTPTVVGAVCITDVADPLGNTYKVFKIQKIRDEESIKKEFESLTWDDVQQNIGNYGVVTDATLIGWTVVHNIDSSAYANSPGTIETTGNSGRITINYLTGDLTLLLTEKKSNVVETIELKCIKVYDV